MCKVKVCAAARPLTDADEKRGDVCHVLTTGIPDQCVLEAKPRHTAANRRLAFLAACRLGASLALNTASSPGSPLQASSPRSPLQDSSPRSPYRPPLHSVPTGLLSTQSPTGLLSTQSPTGLLSTQSPTGLLSTQSPQ